jgi:hypothetical protein
MRIINCGICTALMERLQADWRGGGCKPPSTNFTTSNPECLAMKLRLIVEYDPDFPDGLTDQQISSAILQQLEDWTSGQVDVLDIVAVDGEQAVSIEVVK